MTMVNVDEARLSRTSQVNDKARLKQQLLEFWMRHPNGKFTASVISCTLDYKRGDVRAILNDLVGEGLIETYVREGLTFYKLTGDESKRESLFQYSFLSGSK